MKKLTINDIESVVVDEEFLHPSLKPSHTICVLKLKSGFTVTGESAPVNPEHFDEVLGRTIARQRAIEKVWMLEGYALSISSEMPEGYPQAAPEPVVRQHDEEE